MSKHLVYKPENALLNYENKDMKPPKTKYEHRKYILKKDDVQKITKGKYGREK